MRYEPNEVMVNEEGSVENYGEYAEGLLADDAMLFITVRSASPADVPKVLQVVEHVKRLRHKRDVNAGALSEDLHQYVVYDSQPAGLQRIKLDDPPRNAYTPPSSLSVHLSKIPMPELDPRPTAPKRQPSPQPPRSSPTPSSAQQQRRGGSALFNRDVPAPATIPAQQQQQQQQQHQTTGFGSLWGRPRK